MQPVANRPVTMMMSPSSFTGLSPSSWPPVGWVPDNRLVSMRSPPRRCAIGTHHRRLSSLRPALQPQDPRENAATLTKTKSRQCAMSRLAATGARLSFWSLFHSRPSSHTFSSRAARTLTGNQGLATCGTPRSGGSGWPAARLAGTRARLRSRPQLRRWGALQRVEFAMQSLRCSACCARALVPDHALDDAFRLTGLFAHGDEGPTETVERHEGSRLPRRRSSTPASIRYRPNAW